MEAASNKRRFHPVLLCLPRVCVYARRERAEGKDVGGQQHTRSGVRARLTVYRLNGYVLFGNYRGGVVVDVAGDF